jgi:NHS family xanthosine MFS transporter
MNIKFRLIVMNFLEFFIWGAWLISLGGYMFSSLHATGTQIGLTYGTMGLASLFMPALMGVIADRWVNAEKVLGFCHLVGAGLLIWASKVENPETMYWVILLNSMFFMPTIALNNTVSYITLENKGLDIVKTFPPIRVWGTVGFIVAVWIVDIFGWTLSSTQFIVSAVASLLLALYSFSMPPCLPGKRAQKLSWSESFGLDAFVLFKRKKMAIFFLFAMLLGAALQITNAFGKPFLDDFGSIDAFKDTFGVKIVMLISIIAWVFRFGLFAIGDPGQGLWLLVLSMIIYGMAFDFFNISGSLFVEREAEPKIRASAQGLFMVMTNGVGAYLGGWLSGLVVDYFTVGEVRNWTNIWFTFAAYALVLAIIFPIVFKYKHQKENMMSDIAH